MRVVRVWRLAVAASAATMAMACGGDDGDGGTGTVTPVFTTLTVTPSPATVIVGSTQTLTAAAKDQTGAAMSGLTVTYASSDQTKATVTNAGVITGVAAGTARITATGTIGSVTKTANVDVTVSVPGATASVAATTSNTFEPTTVTISRNGSVTWQFATVHDVIFDSPGGPANIDPTASGPVSRTFPTAGTYPYHCSIHPPNMRGTVVVQ
jgi:plastocyanin